MFGYVNVNFAELSAEEGKAYKAYYCGLCRTLGDSYGVITKLTLNFDMTFLILFLGGYFNCTEKSGSFRCKVHPLKKRSYTVCEFTKYAAAMNVILTYHKLSDDIKDDNSRRAAVLSGMLKKAYEKARGEYPQKDDIIRERLCEIEKIEKADIHNPDIPASCFGNIMGEIFDIYENDEKLYAFGYRLGKAIYIMDACVDFRADIKKCRYNPLIETPCAEFQQILTILLDECTRVYGTIGLSRNSGIVDNVLYSGIWEKVRKKFVMGDV